MRKLFPLLFSLTLVACGGGGNGGSSGGGGGGTPNTPFVGNYTGSETLSIGLAQTQAGTFPLSMTIASNGGVTLRDSNNLTYNGAINGNAVQVSGSYGNLTAPDLPPGTICTFSKTYTGTAQEGNTQPTVTGQVSELISCNIPGQNILNIPISGTFSLARVPISSSIDPPSAGDGSMKAVINAIIK